MYNSAPTNIHPSSIPVEHKLRHSPFRRHHPLHYTYKIDFKIHYTYKMDALPLETVYEISTHLEGEDLVKFSMINKATYKLLSKERSKVKEIVRQRAIKWHRV